MEYYNNILCVSGAELIASETNPGGLISKGLWDKWQRDGASVVRRSSYGKPSLIDLNTVPYKYRDLIEKRYGAPKEQSTVKTFTDKITPDADAITFYSNYLLSDGRNLPEATQREYAANASVLNAIKEIKNNATVSRKALGGSMNGFWPKALLAINNVRVSTGHNLPSAHLPLQRKYDKYINEGYAGLISGKYCNDNSRKVSSEIERLILSLYTMQNKPFGSDVHATYLAFIAGKIEVADRKSGELFNPSQFIHNNKPLELSKATIFNYINQPTNRVIVDKVRSGSHRFNSAVRPHHHRHAPEYSFSKITMDDRDLPRKCVNGKWLKAYYAYDVASGCVVGYSYSMDKDEKLFLDCMRDLFRLIEREGFGMPMEVEVENHLVRKFFDDLAMMFPFVRICNPGNSQEKHAEHLNRAKKYGIEKKTQNGIGRWWSKHEAYTVDRDKVNDEFVEKVYTYERLVADDIQACKDFNNQMHPKQKKYPGKTRWQVLVENMNPKSPEVSKPMVYKSIGEHTHTTINRNQYVTVQYAKYQIANVAVLERLLPNNYSVDAYYLPDGEGMVSEVFLYQNGTYLCKAEKIVEYNTSKAEWTNEDKQGFLHQSSYVSSFDKMAKEGKQELASPVIIEKEILTAAVAQPVTIVESIVLKSESIDDLLNDNSGNDWAANAVKELNTHPSGR